MDVGKRRGGASNTFGWLSALFTAAFAERPAISAKTLVTCNFGIGLLLLLGAGLLLAEPSIGSPWTALAFACAGMVLSAGIVVRGLRPAALAFTLAVHGALFALLAASIAYSCLHWALWAVERGSFRYLPGSMLVPSTYGALQLAEFGPWPRTSRAVRRAGVWLGVLLELSVLVGFAVHLTGQR